MKKILCIIFAILLIFSLAACDAGGNASDEPGELDFGEKKIWKFTEYDPYGDEFVSLWPDELPDEKRPVYVFYGKGPKGQLTQDDVSFTHLNFFLYDFPDPALYFPIAGGNKTFIAEKGSLYFLCCFSEDSDVTQEQFDGYVSWLQKAGYTNDEVIPDLNSYHCERYGVSIDLELTDVFPWTDDDEKLEIFRHTKTSHKVVYMKFQMIDNEYQLDLEVIKTEEYERYLEEFKK